MSLRTAALVLTVCLVMAGTANANNPGDPQFCQPNEGNTWLIINGGTGVWTVDPDCFGNNISNNTTAINPTVIHTTQGGTLTGTNTPSGANYVYTPPTPSFTGIDTFTYTVTTTWNSAGGTGSNCGSCSGRPGGQATMTITLNVIPATMSLTVNGAATPVPVPAGSVTGCGAQGSAGAGPPPGAIPGCTTAVSNLSPPFSSASVAPGHGTLTRTGSTGLTYTPNANFQGTDTFTMFVLGVNTDGQRALSSNEVLVTVTATLPSATGVPTLRTIGMLILAGGLLFFGTRQLRRVAV